MRQKSFPNWVDLLCFLRFLVLYFAEQEVYEPSVFRAENLADHKRVPDLSFSVNKFILIGDDVINHPGKIVWIVNNTILINKDSYKLANLVAPILRIS